MTVYFDNAATTAVRTEAAEKVMQIMTEDYGNPSSSHHMGRNASAELSAARKRVAEALGCAESEIYFTSGGTEADNWAVFGSAALMRHSGKHIVTDLSEHDAIRKAAEKLTRDGYEVTFLKPDSSGRITADAVFEAVREDTVLVSVMLVNNETGAVNPIGDIVKAVRAKNKNAIIHTDAVQGFLKLPFSPKGLGVDLVSISSHKIHGPKGVGALYIRNGVRLPPFHIGGGQERSVRAGTEALPAICGFGIAAELGRREMASDTENMRNIRSRVISRLENSIPEFRVIGDGDAPHILSISLEGYKSEVLMNFLDADGICVSRSSACKKGARSHVLEAMGLKNSIIDGAIRISFSRYSTVDEADYFCDRLTEASKRLFKVL